MPTIQSGQPELQHLARTLQPGQAVGDTAGPGGLLRALRTLPIYAEFARAVRQYCPDARVINYTSPMALCTRVLYAVFPQIKAFGCCHEVFGTQKLLAAAINDMLGEPTPPREDISINVLGINHFTWLDAASLQGMDFSRSIVNSPTSITPTAGRTRSWKTG